MDDFLTTAELAARIRTPAETIRYWRSKGAPTGFPRGFKIGRRIFYRREEVEAWLAAL